jgi:protein subunit release factor A
MDTIIVEIKSAEGGDDSKLLVEEQLRAYFNVCTKNGL